MATKKRIKQYASVTVTKGDEKRLAALRERFRPQFKATAFLSDIMDVYEKAHCSECHLVLAHQICSCKASERL